MATAEILLRGPLIVVACAHDIGLVNQWVAKEHLEAETAALAAELAANAPRENCRI